jgi:glycine dehydrogenase
MTRTSLTQLEARDAFIARHIGPDAAEQEAMLSVLGYASRAALIDALVPANIRNKDTLALGQYSQPLPEQEALNKLKKIASKNKVLKSLIGQGYYNTLTPGVVLRNIFENPAWYTAYTPYQPEISQGRLEAILNFQQTITDLTGMGIANASMLDEGTAAAEAMTLIQRVGKSKSHSVLRRRRRAAANPRSGRDPRQAAGHRGQAASIRPNWPASATPSACCCNTPA